MFKLFRRLLLGVLLLIILLVGVGAFAFYRIDAIAKQGIERGSTYALGVPTTLTSADVGILGGTLSLDGLKISNPPGFDAPAFITLDDGRTTVSLNTLRKDTIVIPELHLTGIDATLIRGAQGANYQVILDNLKKLGGPKPTQPPTSEPAAEKRIIVNELILRDITIHADLAGGGQGALAQAAGQLARVTIPIDEVRLTDVGRTGSGVGGSGVTIGELAGIVVEAVLAAAAEKGDGLLPPELLTDLRSNLAQLGNLDELGLTITAQARELGDKLREAKSPEELRGVIEGGKEDLEKLTDNLKGIIPKREDKKK